MHNLSKALQLYVVDRINNDKRFANLKIVFSDAFVPGEGEHKILEFIRSQRALEGYQANTSHCIHGADADLIMLGLSTHEPHFYILREAVVDSRGPQPETQPFQFVKLPVLREYLYLEFKHLELPFGFDFERLLDDFVFLCFFVGNDFLPHLPSLSIREGAIDAILFIYKHLLPSLGDYLTDGKGGLNYAKVDVLLGDLAKVEEEFFKQHQRNAENNERRRQREEQ